MIAKNVTFGAMNIGQVIDVYEVHGGFRATLWNSIEERKRTVTFQGVTEPILIGDIIMLDGGVGSVATILLKEEVPSEFELVLEPPKRFSSVQITNQIGAVATGI